MSLSDATLADLPADVLRPQYDRTRLTPGIVHVGLGNFHRAHQAWYLHRLMQAGAAHDWAIIGAGVRTYDVRMRENLLAQDCLTTLIELDPNGQSVEVIGSIIDYVPVEDGHRSLIACMSDPAIRIVSLTVTEGGYFLDAQSGRFDPSHADIEHDGRQPDRPRTAFGAMVAALKARRAANHPPFTALSCDNLQGNGGILRQCVVGLARLSDPDLADWIDARCTFPNSMVDCIVPATTADVAASARAFGIADAVPVTHEPFRQWVIEDVFCAGRPAWENVGATLTQEVHLYELMKLRILNGGHQLLANAGEILRLPTIADCIADDDVGGFFRAVEMREIVPFVKPVPQMTPDAYLALIAERFANPAVRDTTRRVAFDGLSRHTGFLLPSLKDGLSAGQTVEGLCLAEALWARMCTGRREDGSVIEPNDPAWAVLQDAAQALPHNPSAWRKQSNIYGTLGSSAGFANAFDRWVEQIWREGCRAALRTYISMSDC